MDLKSLFRRASADSRIFAVLAFLGPFVARLLPELVMGPFITGFDTMAYYVPNVLSWIHGGSSLVQIIAYPPLFYALLLGLNLSGVSLTLSLKVLPPMLLGFLGFAVYVYARKALAWSHFESLGVAFLATLYFVSLRISWDMLRSELALILFFAFLTLLHANWEKKNRQGFLLSMFMVLVALSEQLVALIMFSVVLAFCIQKLSKKEHDAFGRLVTATLPSLAVFGLIFGADYAVSLGFSTISASQWFSLFAFSSVSDALIGTVGFLLFCFLPLLPFVWVGWKNFSSFELKTWIFWCLIGILLGLGASSGLFPMSYRWTLLMSFPLAFFAIEGIKHFRFPRLKLLLSGILIFLSCSFMFLPAGLAFPYFTLFPNYVPSSMLQNTVSLSDCEDVVRAMSWYGQNVGGNGTLLVHDAFTGWADLYLNASCRFVNYGYENPQAAAEKLAADEPGQLYVIWWVPGEGWHGLKSLPSSFFEVFRSGRIAMYEYNNTA
jgi:hypothetical protein